MSAMNQISLLNFLKKFCLGSSEKASGNPILSCFGSSLQVTHYIPANKEDTS
jgi:hypothetical protein